MSLTDWFPEPPIVGRSSKPHSCGLTMVLDKGMSFLETRSLLEPSAPFIDFIKLGFGTLALYPPEVIAQKLNLAKNYQVELYPGGTFLEIAYWKGRFDYCLAQLAEWGFHWVEISDGTITLPPKERASLMSKALNAGFRVITEVGKKALKRQPGIAQIAETVIDDLQAGAEYVIIEARESGIGIGIYDSDGGIQFDKLEFLETALPLKKLLWEAPLKNQQVELIKRFGPNVNLGNIAPSEVMSLEALRHGLRNDTLSFQMRHK